MSSSSSDESSAVLSELHQPSSSRTRRRRRRRRSKHNNHIWPEPFVEALAFQVAVDASQTLGRLSAAQALSNLFQVCSTWRDISRSELLWQNLSRRIWNVGSRERDTWLEEYVYRHRTASNFRSGKYVYTALHYDNNDNDDAISCRRLAISDNHLAAGFSDGAVHLFHLPTRMYVTTFYPQPRDRVGRYSGAVSGIVVSNDRVVFATLDGDIYVAVFNDGTQPRRAHLGDVVNHGVLVDFSGNYRWWIGLFAGVPEHAFHIWNSDTEELLFIGGAITNPESVRGWHLLNELTDLIGRVRVTRHHTALACTSEMAIVVDLTAPGLVLGQEEFPRVVIVGAFDVNDEAALIVDGNGVASVRRTDDLGTELCRFPIQGVSHGGVLDCVNSGYAAVFVGGGIRVWSLATGEYLYSFRELIGEVNAMVANYRYLAACSSEGTIHLWDFGA